MRQMIRKIMFTIIPFLLCMGIRFPAYAMTDEEKELFDALGVEYSLDEKGNFKAFHPDVNMKRMTYEQKAALAEKYKGINKVGSYQVWINMGETPDEFGFIIQDKDSNSVYLEDTCGDSSVIFFDADGDFFNIGYKDGSSAEPINYTEGNIEILENDHNTWTTYQKNEAGDFEIQYKCDGYTFSKYDESGELEEKEDLASGIIYDAEENPIRKVLDTTDMAGLYRSVPYSVADEIQRLMNENGGSMFIYVEQADCNTILPEIMYLITEGQQAQKLGLTLEEYRELHNIYEEVEFTMPTKMMEFVEKEGNHVFNETEPVSESDLPIGISESAIAEELTRLINEYRVANGVEPLDTSDALLQQVADLRAEESTYVMDGAHSRPMAGKAADSFHIGENLAMAGFDKYDTSESIAKTIFDAWKASAGHNRNMLNERYKQGAIGIRLVKEDGRLAAYASHDFSRMSDYEGMVTKTTKERIAIGPQVPGNINSVEEYYEKMYHGNIPEGDYYYEDEIEDKAPSYEDVEVVPYGPQILDENGNKFQLPNGEEWTEAQLQFNTWEGSASDREGGAHDVTTGWITFYTASGSYQLYITDEWVDFYDDCDPPNLIKSVYYLNNVSGNAIVLKQSEFNTLSSVFPGGYDGNYASESTYYIVNGETIEFPNVEW